MRRAPLWVAFAVVHLTVAWAGFVLPSQPMGDVYNVYEPWSRTALTGGPIVGVDEPWVYPQLALLPMMLAWAFAWAGSYTVGWAIVATLCDAAAFALLVGRGRSAGRRAAAWFWLGALLVLGPVGLYRLDAITVPLAIAGCLWLVGRPRIAAALLAVATWMKVWPAALLGAAVIAVRRRGAVLIGAAGVTVVTVVVVVAAGGAASVLGFLADQTERGLQVEAPVSTFYVWQTLAGVPGAAIFYNAEIITFEVVGPSSAAVAAAMTPVLLVVGGAVAAVGAVKAWRGAAFARLFPPLALALVLALIVTNKVGSPQYLSWLIPPVVIAVVIDRARAAGPAAVVLLAAGLTQLVYPVLYDPLLRAEIVPVAILTARNLLLVALFAWSCVRLARVPVGRRSPARADTR